MIKRSPAIANPNSAKAAWFPRNIPNIQVMLMKLAGLDPEVSVLFPEMESYNINLRFTLNPGQTQTESIASKNGTWILLEKMATIKVSGPSNYEDYVTVSSSIYADKTGTTVSLIEEQPVLSIFGTGQWQSDIFPDVWTSVNNRIFSVKNLSPSPVIVDLGFKLARVAPKAQY